MYARRHSLISLIVLALLLAACSMTAPQATPPPTAMATELPAAEASPVAQPAVSVTNTPSSAAANIPLQDALGSLEPKDVFENFYAITQVPRPSESMDQIRAFLVKFGQDLGLETIADEAGNVLIRKPAAAGAENRQGVVLQAHMDMVVQTAEGGAFDPATDPIAAFVNGDYVVANGTSLGADNGIGMAMIMAILQSKTLQTGPLEALFTADEETDMSGANGLKGDLLKGRTLINLDSDEEGIFTVGSAGGEHVTVQSSYAQVPAPADMVSYLVQVRGLKGGHSGTDINLGLGHAMKLLVRLLEGAMQPYELRLASIVSGTACNAIPRDASVLVFLPAGQVEAFTQYVQAYETTIKSELAAVEADLSVKLAAVQGPAQVMDEAFQATLIDALYAHPQGVMRMSNAVPGLVETSTNVGITNAQDGQIQVVSCPRSSVDSALVDIGQMIASVWELAGYPVAFTDQYKGWNPNPESPIVGLMQDTYQELYGQEPGIMAFHVGLECGTIGAVYPDMDMISIGPTTNKVHSFSERLFIPSVEKVMDLVSETLERMPEK